MNAHELHNKYKQERMLISAACMIMMFVVGGLHAVQHAHEIFFMVTQAVQHPTEVFTSVITGVAQR